MVEVERHEDQPVRQSVVDEDLVGLRRETGCLGADRSKASTIEKPGNRLDHILVRQEG